MQNQDNFIHAHLPYFIYTVKSELKRHLWDKEKWSSKTTDKNSFNQNGSIACSNIELNVSEMTFSLKKTSTQLFLYS